MLIEVIKDDLLCCFCDGRCGVQEAAYCWKETTRQAHFRVHSPWIEDVLAWYGVRERSEVESIVIWRVLCTT